MAIARVATLSNADNMRAGMLNGTGPKTTTSTAHSSCLIANAFSSSMERKGANRCPDLYARLIVDSSIRKLEASNDRSAPTSSGARIYMGAAHEPRRVTWSSGGASKMGLDGSNGTWICSLSGGPVYGVCDGTRFAAETGAAATAAEAPGAAAEALGAAAGAFDVLTAGVIPAGAAAASGAASGAALGSAAFWSGERGCSSPEMARRSLSSNGCTSGVSRKASSRGCTRCTATSRCRVHSNSSAPFGTFSWKNCDESGLSATKTGPMSWLRCMSPILFVTISSGRSPAKGFVNAMAPSGRSALEGARNCTRMYGSSRQSQTPFR
mmetsp:Transcript_802/g.1750  ORF Transcript_802/g.1750 Transcript_802/m.1750 type:complete len:324 (-) Transcript_802:209-1180(-)